MDRHKKVWVITWICCGIVVSIAGLLPVFFSGHLGFEFDSVSSEDADIYIDLGLIENWTCSNWTISFYDENGTLLYEAHGSMR